MFYRATASLISVLPIGLLLVVPGVVPAATVDHPPAPPVANVDQVAPVSPADRAFVEDLERRSFEYFWEQADHGTGLVLDRARVDGGGAQSTRREIASAAPTRVG